MVVCRAVRSLLAVTLIVAALAGPTIATAQEASPPAEAPNKYDEWEQFPPAWERALRTLGDDTLYLLSSPLRLSPESGLVVLGIGAGIAGIALADRSIHDAASHRNNGTHDAADAIAYLGDPAVLLGLNVGVVAIGEGIRQATGQSKLLDAALVATEAQLLTLGFTEAIAYGTARARPDQSNDPGQWFTNWGHNDSFPSSHASQTFAVAAVIHDRFGLGPGIVAYGLAGLVGAARIIQDKHWASDVVAGAALGWAVGHFLSVRNSERHPYLDFFPFADLKTKTYGFVIEKKF